MNELIKITINQNDEQIVSGRMLHEFLEVKTEYRHWIKRKIEYGFTENEDYTLVIFDHPQNHQQITDHALKLDMAKEIAMLEKNEKGKQARQYFIQIEKDWNSPDKIMARALKIANQRIHVLRLENIKKEQLIGELKPKADYVDWILKSKGTVNINAIAKDYGMSARQINKILHSLKVQYYQDGQWLLYAQYQNKGYTHSKTINFEHSDGSPDTRLHTKWTQKGRLFLYDLLKKNDIFPVIERSKKEAIL